MQSSAGRDVASASGAALNGFPGCERRHVACATSVSMQPAAAALGAAAQCHSPRQLQPARRRAACGFERLQQLLRARWGAAQQHAKEQRYAAGRTSPAAAATGTPAGRPRGRVEQAAHASRDQGGAAERVSGARLASLAILLLLLLVLVVVVRNAAVRECHQLYARAPARQQLYVFQGHHPAQRRVQAAVHLRHQHVLLGQHAVQPAGQRMAGSRRGRRHGAGLRAGGLLCVRCSQRVGRGAVAGLGLQRGACGVALAAVAPSSQVEREPAAERLQRVVRRQRLGRAWGEIGVDGSGKCTTEESA